MRFEETSKTRAVVTRTATFNKVEYNEINMLDQHVERLAIAKYADSTGLFDVAKRNATGRIGDEMISAAATVFGTNLALYAFGELYGVQAEMAQFSAGNGRIVVVLVKDDTVVEATAKFDHFRDSDFSHINFFG